MWRLQDSAEATNMKELLLTMDGQVSSLQSIEVGINTSSHKSAYDIVFIGTFLNKEAIMEFENDSFHKSVGVVVGSLKQERVVVEYEF